MELFEMRVLKACHVCFAALFLLLAPYTYAQWTEPVRISSDPHPGIPRVVAVGDTMHVAATTHFNIYYLRSNNNGETWTDPICPLEDFYGSRTPDIISSNGKLHMAFIGRYQSGEPIGVYNVSSSDGGRSWGEPYEVYYNGWKYPRLAASGDTLFLSSVIPGQILVFVSYDNGESWSDPYVAEQGSLVIDSWPNILYFQGRIQLIYQINDADDSVGIEIYHRFSDDHGLTWSERYPLSTEEPVPYHEHSQFPSATADSQGNLMALWFDYKYGSECGFTGDILGRVSRDNGETWLPETRLTYTQTGSSSTCLIVKDTLHAIWMDEDLFGCGYRKLMYSLSYDWGQTWSQAAIIYDSDELNEHQPFLFHNTQERGDMLHCIMLGDLLDGTNDLYYVRRTGVTQVSEHNSEAIPNELSIMAYPNPFNSSTMISFVSLEGDNTEIEIFNLLGQRINSFTIEGAKEGKINWDARDALGNKVSSGIYFARAKAPRISMTIKLIYLK